MSAGSTSSSRGVKVEGVAQPSQRLVLGQRWRSGVEMVQLPTAQARSRVLGIPGEGK